MSEPLYTVSRCRAQTGDLYGPTHGSMDARKEKCAPWEMVVKVEVEK